MSEGSAYGDSMSSSVDPSTMRLSVTPVLDGDEQLISASQASTTSFPCTPSPTTTTYNRRPSTVSSGSWETAYSAQSSDLSLQYPHTPPTEEGHSPDLLFMSESQNFFNVMPSDMPTLPEFCSPLSMCPTGEGSCTPMAPKGQMDVQSFDEFQPELFNDVIFPTCPTSSTSVPGPANDGSLYGFGKPYGFLDMSSPIARFTTGAGGPSTVAPSSILTDMSTPGQGLVRRHMRPSPIDCKVGSSENGLSYSTPFTAPSSPFSPVSMAYNHASRTSLSDLASISQTPSRRASRLKGRKGACQRYADTVIPLREHRNPYACKHRGCDRRFKRQEHLKRHEISHDKEYKPFTCPVECCRKPFSRKDNLNSHSNTHRRQGGRNAYIPDYDLRYGS